MFMLCWKFDEDVIADNLICSLLDAMGFESVSGAIACSVL
jgi:hypothetical protein